jgi:hypothetical protein
MSNRGFFSSLSSNQLYQQSEKEWIVELDFCYKYWYDLAAKPTEMFEGADTKKYITNYLKELKNEVNNSLEKRFVYFICSRERVRFNIYKKPSYNPFTGNKKIHILVGENKYKKSIKCKFIDKETGRHYNPDLILREKYITIKSSDDEALTMSIHDFLEYSKVNLKINSQVEYVGLTKNPDKRPTNGAHTGLNDVLYSVLEGKKDTFVYFNVFKVYSRTDNPIYNMSFMLANAMIDEINVDLEGSILEKCFILYFDSDNQFRNKDKECKELRKNLIKLSEENKINSLSIYYTFPDKNEYGIFASSKVLPSHEHSFIIKNNGDDIEIERDSKIIK